MAPTDVTDDSRQALLQDYSIAPLGKPQPARAKFDSEWQNVDLAAFTDFMELKGIRMAGRCTCFPRKLWRKINCTSSKPR